MLGSTFRPDWHKEKPSLIQSSMKIMRNELIGLYIARDKIQEEIADREWQMTDMAQALAAQGWTYDKGE